MSPVELGVGVGTVTVTEVEQLCQAYGVDFGDFYRGGKECGEWDETQARRKRWEAFEASARIAEKKNLELARKLEELEVVALVDSQQAEAEATATVSRLEYAMRSAESEGGEG